MGFNKAKIAAAAALVLGSMAVPMANAVGVAGTVAKSGLYEPLRADVRIALSQGEDAMSSAARIAPIDKFAAVGMAYPSFVGDLHVTTEKIAGAKDVILRIRSSKPIFEPVLKLLIEARIGNSGVVYLPVTIMLDSSFDNFSSSNMEASIPMGKASEEKKSKSGSSKAESKERQGAAPDYQKNPPALAKEPAVQKSKEPLPAPQKAKNLKERADAGGKNIETRLDALEKGQSDIKTDLGKMKAKVEEIGSSLEALREIAAKAAKPVEAQAKPVEQSSKPADPTSSPMAAATKNAEASKTQEEALKIAETQTPAPAAASTATAAATVVASPTSAPSEKAPETSVTPTSASASATPTPDGSGSQKPAAESFPELPAAATTPAPTEKPAASKPAVKQPEPAPVQQEDYTLWAALSGLAAVLGAGGFWLSRKRKAKQLANPSIEMDTDLSGIQTLETPSHEAQAEEPPVTHFSPSSKMDSDDGLNTIDDLQSKIFGDDGVESLMREIDLSSIDDKVQNDRRSTDGLNIKVDSHVDEPLQFEMPPLPVAEPADEPLNFDFHPEAPAPSVAETPKAQPQKREEEAPLDLSALNFDSLGSMMAEPQRKDAEPVRQPSALDLDEPLQFDMGLSLSEKKTEPAVETPLSFDAPIAEDPFAKAMSLARSAEARSGGDPARHFIVPDHLEDSPGKIQLELACLYAQSKEWANAKSTLKEIISDDELAAVHEEARRLLSKLPI